MKPQTMKQTHKLTKHLRRIKAIEDTNREK